MKDKARKLLPVFIVIAALGAVGGLIWQQNGLSTIEGRIEQVTVPHYSQVGGRIVQLMVSSGQMVEEGELLAIIDSSSQQYALQQLEQVLIQKQAALEQLLTGAEPAAIQQAKDAVQIAQVGYENAQLQYQKQMADFQKAETLYQAGGISEQAYEELANAMQISQNNLSAAASQISTAQQQVVLLSGNADKAAVKAAQAAVTQTEIQIAEAKEQLDKYQILASCTGTVTSINYTENAMVNAGSDLIELADMTQTDLVAYLPVKQLQQVSYGQVVTVRCEENIYKGAIHFIDVKAQYTPREFQNAVQKDQSSIKIKVRLPADTSLKPGQTASVQLEPKA